ncbi:hypothetical protein [Nitrospira lenta]|uniref:Lipoprotein n=1 Tax=Nitrospira lenta TaxID=1436998 RepID=A0A330L460_9BACT|nr:hypothetical protein [Nitrospira lenta]SPP63692.1 conserved exported hypothetical protein [Nitrospira lenta]
MKSMMLRQVVGVSLVGVLAVMAGCVGKGETRYLDVRTPTAAAPSPEQEPVKIVIEPFEDRRDDKTRVGQRTHLWGGATVFNVAGERPGEVIAQALADRLKNRGWRGRPWKVQVGRSADVPDADIVISGQVSEFFVTAKSRVFSTVINASNKFSVRARNVGDNSTTIRSVEGAQRTTVFWFAEGDAQELLAATLKDGIDRFVADTMVTDRALRPAH